MADEQEETPSKEEKVFTEKELALRREKIKRSSRNFYLRNKHWSLEAQRQKRAAARAKTKPKPKTRPKPKPTQAQVEALKELRRKNLEPSMRERTRKALEWKELGWLVAKMNIQGGFSQQKIYELLGGLATKKQISRWCTRGKKGASLRRPR